MRKLLAVGVAVALFVVVSFAADGVKMSPAKMALLSKVSQKIAQWGHDPAIVAAVRAQNAKAVSVAELKKINAAWSAGGEEQLAISMLQGPCADRLHQFVSQGAFTEAFVMDERGANACMTNRTTYYWRGEMPKFQKAFDNGKGAVFIDEPKWDESAKARLVQVSVPVVDGGKAIGVLTVGVNADALGN